MELKNLYSSIQNPIDDINKIRLLIEEYSKNAQNSKSFYPALVMNSAKQYHRGEHYQIDFDNFYSKMFNKWKNSIVAMERSAFETLYRQGSFGADFVKMRQYLKGVKDVTTEEETREIFFGKKGDKELEDALEKYRWSAFGEFSGWIHVCSRYITAKKDPYPDIEHRLYLNTESVDTYKMINLLVDKFDEHHLPYYFKFDLYGNRDDTIVIYTSTKDLELHLRILEEIKLENPELVARIKEPPILTGKIDNWIGYGSEPDKSVEESLRSFNLVRAEAIELAIKEATYTWVMTHKYMQITYQGKALDFQEYVAILALEYIINSLKPQLSVNKLTYFKNRVFANLQIKMPAMLESVCKDHKEESAPIPICTDEEKLITFTEKDLEKVLRKLAKIIARNDPNFVYEVQSLIKKKSTAYGIDPQKYCFDIAAKDKIDALIKQTDVNMDSNVDNKPFKV